MIKLIRDIRDKHYYQHFGQTTDFPEQITFDRPIIDTKQDYGDVRCTCITCVDISVDKDGVIYSIDDLASRVTIDRFGADPRQVLGETVKNGLLPVGKFERVKLYNSYWTAHKGNLDAFDNVRSAMTLAKLPVAIWSPWYSEWMGVNVLPIGKTVSNYHMYDVEGWEEINGEPMFIVEAWVGYKMYMSRDVFNELMKNEVCGSAVLSTVEVDEIRKKTIMESMIEYMKNVISLLQQLIVKKKPMTPYQPISEVVVPESTVQKYWWDTKENARHSVRTICDEMDLSVQQKNELCATVGAESNWNPKAIGKPNFDGTRDYGIVQVNEKYWIGEGKLFPSKDYVLNNPEVCIRWMIKEWKAGHQNWWYGFKNGSYKRFL